MNLDELDNFKLSKAISFNTDLNPQIFIGDKMRPLVRKKLMQIADHFREFLGVQDIALIDIEVSGSNAAYSYTPHSDVDLHLIVDFTKLPNNEVYKEMFDAKKYQYNQMHSIKIKGYDVELYVQDAAQKHASLGSYSVLNNEWNRIPTRQRANLNDDATILKYEKLKNLAIRALASDSPEYLNDVLDLVKKYRQAGLDQYGEFGPENLAFKMLRTDGYFAKLWAKKRSHVDRDLSLEQAKEEPDTLAQEIRAEFEAGATTQATEGMVKRLCSARDNLFDEFDYDRVYEDASNLVVLEASNQGDVSLMEVMQFYHQAPKEQIDLLSKLVEADLNKQAWQLIQKYTSTTIVSEADKSYQPPEIEVGDEVKVGKFKNRKATVKGFDTDKDNQPVLKTTKGDHKLFKPRISKLEKELEEGVGIIVKDVNTTADVGVGQTKIEADKLHLNCDADGIPEIPKNGVPKSLYESLILHELNMAPGKLQRHVDSIITSADPRIGIEFEIIIPRDRETNPDIEDNTSMQDIRDFFEYDEGDIFADFENGYQEWVGEKQQAWAEIQAGDTLNNPAEESERKEEFMIDFYTMSGDADDIVAKITDDEDDTEITSEIADKVIRTAHKAYKESGDADTWPEGIGNSYIRLYKEIFVDDNGEAEEMFQNFYAEEFYNYEYSEDDYAVGTWLRSKHMNSMGDVYREFENSLTWPGGPMGNDEFNDELAYTIANELEDVVGETVSMEGGDSYGDTDTSKTWVVTGDASIKPDADGDSGFEIVTPIMQYKDGIATAENVIDYLKEKGGYANETTGLHINVSLGNISQSNLDYGKLVLMLGDSHILKHFGREFNEYTENALVKMSEMMDDQQGYSRDKPAKAKALAVLMNSMRADLSDVVRRSFDQVNFGKYSSVNLRNGWIEFRSAGGVDYIYDFEAIHDSINRFIVAYAVASDPDANRKEYGKKLYKLASNVGQGQVSKNAMTLFAGFGSGMITKEDLIRQLKARRSEKAEVDTGEPIEPAGVVDAVQMIADKYNIPDTEAREAYEDGKEAEMIDGKDWKAAGRIAYLKLINDIGHYKR